VALVVIDRLSSRCADHAQAIELARVLFDQVIPPGRNAR